MISIGRVFTRNIEPNIATDFSAAPIVAWTWCRNVVRAACKGIEARLALDVSDSQGNLCGRPQYSSLVVLYRRPTGTWPWSSIAVLSMNFGS